MENAQKVTKTTVTTTTTVTEEVINPKVVETHYLLILDKSGSMSSVRQATINNFNEQLQTIKKLEEKYPDQKYFISLITFSDDMQEVMMDIPVSEVKQLTEENYVPNGLTALHHAMGMGITRLQDKISPKMTESDKIVSAVVVVMTDGGENNSHIHPEKWDVSKVKPLIEKLNKDQRWTISFLGANQDSVLVSSSLGIDRGNTLNYHSTIVGTSNASQVLSKSMNTRGSYIANGYSSVVGGGIGNTVLFSSVLDGNTIDEDEQKLKDKLKNNEPDQNI